MRRTPSLDETARERLFTGIEVRLAGSFWHLPFSRQPD